jgi:hypothetical protein
VGRWSALLALLALFALGTGNKLGNREEGVATVVLALNALRRKGTLRKEANRHINKYINTKKKAMSTYVFLTKKKKVVIK